jgi:hypothetical protein
MKLSTHYYVLLLSEYTSRLFEGFRDTLIDIVQPASHVRIHPIKSHPRLLRQQLNPRGNFLAG